MIFTFLMIALALCSSIMKGAAATTLNRAGGTSGLSRVLHSHQQDEDETEKCHHKRKLHAHHEDEHEDDEKEGCDCHENRSLHAHRDEEEEEEKEKCHDAKKTHLAFVTAGTRTKCPSDDSGYDRMVRITDDLIMYWSISVADPKRRTLHEGHDDEENDHDEDSSPLLLSVRLRYNGLGWIAFGTSPSKEGTMVESEAIIGIPNGTPLKYHLGGKERELVQPMAMSSQTLMDAGVTQGVTNTSEEITVTTLVFAKLLEEEGEISISPGSSQTFVWAVGDGNELGYHKSRGSFTLNLSRCGYEDNDNDDVPILIWIAHGIMGTLAWAVAAPLAVVSAWFRTLSDSWFVFHKYANLTCALLTFTAVLLAMTHMEWEEQFTENHHIVGGSIAVFMAMQVTSGFLRLPKLTHEIQEAKPGTMSKRNLWKVFHRSLGVLLLGMGVWQVQDGLVMFADMYDTVTLAPFYWWYFFIFVVGVLLVKLYTFFGIRDKNVTEVEVMPFNDEDWAVESEIDPFDFMDEEPGGKLT